MVFKKKKSHHFVLRKKKSTVLSLALKIVGVLSCCFSVTLLEDDYFAHDIWSLHKSHFFTYNLSRCWTQPQRVNPKLKQILPRYQDTKKILYHDAWLYFFQLIHHGSFKRSASPSFLHVSLLLFPWIYTWAQSKAITTLSRRSCVHVS